MQTRRLSMLLVAGAGVACLTACSSATGGEAEFAGLRGATVTAPASSSEVPSSTASASPSDVPSRQASDSPSSGSGQPKPPMCAALRQLDLKAVFGRTPKLDDLGDGCTMLTDDTMIYVPISFNAEQSVVDKLNPGDAQPVTIAGQPGLYRIEQEMAVSTVGDIHKDGCIYIILDDAPSPLANAKQLISQLMPTYGS